MSNVDICLAEAFFVVFFIVVMCLIFATTFGCIFYHVCAVAMVRHSVGEKTFPLYKQRGSCPFPVVLTHAVTGRQIMPEDGREGIRTPFPQSRAEIEARTKKQCIQ